MSKDFSAHYRNFNASYFTVNKTCTPITFRNILIYERNVLIDANMVSIMVDSELVCLSIKKKIIHGTYCGSL